MIMLITYDDDYASFAANKQQHLDEFTRVLFSYKLLYSTGLVVIIIIITITCLLSNFCGVDTQIGPIYELTVS